MAKTLAQFLTAIRTDLDDAGSATWSDTELTRGVRRALFDFSRIKPAEVIGTITLAADGREISLATLTGLVDVQRVWTDYTASDPDHPPEWVKFELWDDKTTLFINEDTEPQSGDVVRIFYTKWQTIKDLDSETATTVPTEDEELIILGACGYAAQIKARKAIAQINPADTTPAQWAEWSKARLSEFYDVLDDLAAHLRAAHDPRVQVDWEI